VVLLELRFDVSTRDLQGPFLPGPGAFWQ
jgi:hypothetical protein